MSNAKEAARIVDTPTGCLAATFTSEPRRSDLAPSARASRSSPAERVAFRASSPSFWHAFGEAKSVPLLTADLDWNVLTWIEFVRGATAYRDHFSRQAREDAAYLACYRALRREDSMLARVGRSREIVTFLNAWACRLDSKKAPAVFRGWIYAHGSELEELGLVALTDRDVPGLSREVDGLYDSVIALRSELHNMSDAAASKVLHQLVPDLFVMWDKAIKQVAMMQGYGRYSGFLVAMHELSRRLLDQADMTRDEAEVYLQRELGYSTRKTFAKYVDEANWYWTVGRYSALHGAQ